MRQIGGLKLVGDGSAYSDGLTSKLAHPFLFVKNQPREPDPSGGDQARRRVNKTMLETRYLNEIFCHGTNL